MSVVSNLNSIRFFLGHPLNQGQKIRATKKWLRWQMASRLVPAPIMMPWVDKTLLIASKGETGITQNIYCGLQDFAEMAFVLHFTRAEDRFIDIGANSGVYSVLAAGCCGARGIAVEPVPSTFEKLTRQIRLNQLEELVSACNVGVAGTPGVLYFKTDSDTQNQIVDKNWPGPKALLPVTTIDELAREVPAIMKIDVEGHDEAVLSGSTKTLVSDQLKAIIIEMSPASIPILSGHGFIPCEYDPFQRRLRKMEWHDAAGFANVIAVRDWQTVQARLTTAVVRNFHGNRF